MTPDNSVLVFFRGDATDLKKVVDDVKREIKSLEQIRVPPQTVRNSAPPLLASDTVKSAKMVTEDIRDLNNGLIVASKSAGQLNRDLQVAPQISLARDEVVKLASEFGNLGGRAKSSLEPAANLLSILPASTAAIIGAGAAAITVTKLITDDIATRAERRLKVEESITAELNKQRLAVKEQADEFERQRKQATDDRRFNRQLKTIADNIPELQRTRSQVEQELTALRARQLKEQEILSMTPTRLAPQTGVGRVVDWTTQTLAAGLAFGRGDTALASGIWSGRSNDPNFGMTEKDRKAAMEALEKRQTRELTDLQQRIEKIDVTLENAQISAATRLKSTTTTTVRSLIDEYKEFMDNVKKGRDRVFELAEGWKKAFSTIAVQANKDNPMVKLFVDSDIALTKLKESLKGLPKDLQQAALDSQRNFNLLQLFGARLNNTFEAFDLREMARKFQEQNVASSGKSLADAMKPNTDRAEQELQKFKDAAERLRQANLPITFAVNEQARQSYIDQRRKLEQRLTGEDISVSAQARLDRQIGLLRGFDPRNEAEKSLIDRRLLTIAGQLNPADLRSDQNNAIAAAAERQAARVEAREQEAIRVYKAQLEVQGKILEAQNELLKVANGKGIEGINKLLVEIKNETGTNVKAIEEPTPEDTTNNYDYLNFRGILPG